MPAAPAIVVLWLLTYSFQIASSGETLRYLVYLAPVALWLFAIVRSASLERFAVAVDPDALRFLLGYAAIWFVAKFNSPLPPEYGTADLIFITIPFFAVLFPTRVTANTDRILVWSGIAVGSIFVLGNLGHLVRGFDIVHSKGGLESGLAFTFTVATIVSAYFRRRVLFLLSLAFCILFFKRIAFMSLLTSLAFLAFMYLIAKLRGATTEAQVMRTGKIAFWIVTIGCVLVALELNNIVQFVHNHMFHLYRSSPEELFLGRYKINQFFHRAMSGFDLYSTLFGQGPASVYWMLYARLQSNLHNVHNDFLKLLFEYGWVGLCVYIYLYYKLFSRSLLGLALGINTMVLYVTDNTLIYVSYQLFAVFAAASLKRDSIAPAPAARPPLQTFAGVSPIVREALIRQRARDTRRAAST